MNGKEILNELDPGLVLVDQEEEQTLFSHPKMYYYWMGGFRIVFEVPENEPPEWFLKRIIDQTDHEINESRMYAWVRHHTKQARKKMEKSDFRLQPGRKISINYGFGGGDYLLEKE